MDKLKEVITRNGFGMLLYWLPEFSSEIPLHVIKKTPTKPTEMAYDTLNLLHSLLPIC